MSDYSSWSIARIEEEIANNEAYVRQLEDAIEHHTREYERRPQDGFQGRDLETALFETNRELRHLRATKRAKLEE